MSGNCTAEKGIIKLQCNHKEHLKLLIIAGFVSIAEVNTQNYNVEKQKLASWSFHFISLLVCSRVKRLCELQTLLSTEGE
jgi:hypothetical protein